MSNSNLHNHTPLPVFVAGGACGRMKGGRHIKYPNDTPMANLLVTMLAKAGLTEEHSATAPASCRKFRRRTCESKASFSAYSRRFCPSPASPPPTATRLWWTRPRIKTPSPSALF